MPVDGSSWHKEGPAINSRQVERQRKKCYHPLLNLYPSGCCCLGHIRCMNPDCDSAIFIVNEGQRSFETVLLLPEKVINLIVDS